LPRPHHQGDDDEYGEQKRRSDPKPDRSTTPRWAALLDPPLRKWMTRGSRLVTGWRAPACRSWPSSCDQISDGIAVRRSAYQEGASTCV
jgi:hypothetical protein